jgi:hypothetical protein
MRVGARQHLKARSFSTSPGLHPAAVGNCKRLLNGCTGSYMSGFVVLGALVILGGIALLIYGRVVTRPEASVGLAA